MSEQPNSAGRIRAVYRVFGPFLAPYRGRIAGAYGALIGGVLFGLLRPWPLKLILDAVILHKRRISEVIPFAPSGVDRWDPFFLLTVLCAAMVVIVVLESFCGYFQKVLFAKVGHGVTTDVLEHSFAHLQSIPRSLGKARSGDVILRLTSDVKTLRDLLVEHVQKFGSYILTLIGTLGVMLWMNWRLALLGLSVAPFLYWASARFSSQLRAAARQKRTQEGSVASVVQETLHSLSIIQAFAQEEAESRRFRHEARQSLEANVETSRLGGVFNRSITVLNTLGTALVVWFGASRVLSGTLSPGDLIVFVSYINDFYKPVQSLSELSVQFMESLVSGERVLELLQTAPRIHDDPHAIPAPPLKGEVAFDHVTFGYQPEKPALQDVEFRLEPGQKAALVGGSGAGKSTILNLLLRFYDPNSGVIRLDGHDIREFRLHSLRQQVSVVFQESVLFRRTVAENIAYGKPHSGRDEVIAAAKAAQAHEFIEALPNGYDTVLDEMGRNLSGGQRQRISLARAFLRNAPILILDEPTSGLDAVTEAQLSETLEELSRGKTTITIAHRLATVEKSDLILVLDQGHIVQRGTHAELIAQEGLYRELYQTQAAAPLPTSEEPVAG